MVGADPRDVVGTLDAGQEWGADTRFEGGFVQRVRLTGDGIFSKAVGAGSAPGQSFAKSPIAHSLRCACWYGVSDK